MRAGLGLVLGLLLAAWTLAGCSGSSDGAAPTAAPTTTSTKPEITDQEIIDGINERIRPALEATYDAEQVDCIIGVLQDGGVGKLSADDLVPAYEDRCGVTATAVTGVITASALLQRGASKQAAACVADAIAKRSYEEVAALGELGTNQLYERCGIDVAALTTG
jgi:hypothetical protein